MGRLETIPSGKDRLESRCDTVKFSLCPTGGQVVAGSNPVSPTQVRSHFRTKLWSLIGQRTPTAIRH